VARIALFDGGTTWFEVVCASRKVFQGNVAEVTISESESLDAALRRFNKRVQSEGILTAARRHEYYEKPSEKRKKKEAARRRKLRKSIIKAQKRREFF
jgi:small subunit ribosomal protein S21